MFHEDYVLCVSCYSFLWILQLKSPIFKINICILGYSCVLIKTFTCSFLHSTRLSSVFPVVSLLCFCLNNSWFFLAIVMTWLFCLWTSFVLIFYWNIIIILLMCLLCSFWYSCYSYSQFLMQDCWNFGIWCGVDANKSWLFMRCRFEILWRKESGIKHWRWISLTFFFILIIPLFGLLWHLLIEFSFTLFKNFSSWWCYLS